MSVRHGVVAWLLLVLVGSIPLPRLAYGEETVLFFERQSRTVLHQPPSRGADAVVDTSRVEILVALGDRRLTVYEPGEVWVYDFERRRVMKTDPKAGIYSDWSLFAFVAFHEMELDHRLGLRSRIMTARGRRTGPSVLDVETMFSMKATSARPGARESLADSSHRGRFRYFVNDALAVQAAPSDTVLDPARRAMFERFLLYRCHLHPDARGALMRSGRLPRQLYYRYRDFDQETQVILTLIRLASAPETNDPLAVSRRVDISDPAYAALQGLLTACRTCADGRREPWLEATRRFEDEWLQTGRYLDAALARAERALACEHPAKWRAEIESRAGGDQRLAAYRAGLQWNDSAGAATALTKLDAIDRSGLEKAHVLDLTRGRAHLAVGDVEAGTALLLHSLTGNPCLAGAWAELGQAYLKAYQPVLAWACFDAARGLAPAGCAALSEGDRLERGLLQRHPEFFE